MNLVFTRIQGENSCSRLRSLLLYSCDVFQALNSLPLFTGCTSGSAGIYSISSLQRMIIPEVSFQLSVVHSLTETLCLQGTRKTLRNLFLTLPSRRQPWPSPSTTGCGPLTAGRLILPSWTPLSSPKTLKFTQCETVAFATVSPHRVNADR